MSDWTVRRRGTDSSGRGIYASDYMWSWWLDLCEHLGFTPTIVQGAWMTLAGGGAGESAGYHDGGGCFDLRVWDRTEAEVTRLVRGLRAHGAAAWLRDAAHGGMDPHIHFVLGSDHDLDDGAAWQWRQYIDGRDGLSSNGPDYHWRPDPLVLTPPKEDDMTPEQAKKLDDIAGDVNAIKERLDAVGKNAKKRDAAIREQIRKRFGATDKVLDEILAEVDK